MNTPLSWVKAYVPELSCTAREYMDAMTLSGTKVEGFEQLDADLDKIVIGQIEKIEREKPYITEETKGFFKCFYRYFNEIDMMYDNIYNILSERGDKK